MNELELLHDLRGGITEPDATRLAAGRERLLASISTPYRRTSRTYRRSPGPTRAIRLVSGAVAALALTAAVAVVVLSAPRQPAARVRLSLADQVLRSAALQAGSRRATKPRPHQWVFSRTVGYSLGSGRTRSDGWVRFDGRRGGLLPGREADPSSRTASSRKRRHRAHALPGRPHIGHGVRGASVAAGPAASAARGRGWSRSGVEHRGLGLGCGPGQVHPRADRVRLPGRPAVECRPGGTAARRGQCLSRHGQHPRSPRRARSARRAGAPGDRALDPRRRSAAAA